MPGPCRDPQAADLRYEAAATRIRETARGDGFELVATQNAAYGFRRNMYGCRAWAISSSAVAVLGVVALRLLEMTTWPVVIAFALVAGVWAVALRLTIDASFVRGAADRYAEALLGAVHHLT